MRISDWSSDVCSSDLLLDHQLGEDGLDVVGGDFFVLLDLPEQGWVFQHELVVHRAHLLGLVGRSGIGIDLRLGRGQAAVQAAHIRYLAHLHPRSEEHTSEIQSLMRTSYDVFCLKKKT